WIGKLRLHANVARFSRKDAANPPHNGVKVVKPKISGANAYEKHSFSCKENSYANVAKGSVSSRSVGDNMMIMGNFNEVREAGERYGSNFNSRQADIFNDFHEVFPSVTGVVLKKGIPDHRPILLKDFEVDYGPTPFRFFHSWLDMEGFRELVADTWNNDGINDVNGLISFKKKLQNLKRVIREWVTSKRSKSNKINKHHQMRLFSIDVKIDQGRTLQEDFSHRRDSIKIFGDIERLEAKDIAQKAKAKWALEANENTNGDMPNHLSSGQSDYIENPFSHDEIKRAIWDYGGDRAPGPDGFTFKIFTTFLDVIEADVIRFVQEFFLTGPFKMGKCIDEFASSPDGPYLGPERDRVFTDLSQPEKGRLKADIRATNILLQGSELTKDNRKS
ncbi:hypothetical protein Tco_1039350, partial [Tanacetum coccineum]